MAVETLHAIGISCLVLRLIGYSAARRGRGVGVVGCDWRPGRIFGFHVLGNASTRHG